MATRIAKKTNGNSKGGLGLAMAVLAATAGVVKLLNTGTRRKKLARVAGKLGKAAATVMAASEVISNAGPLLMRRKPRSRLTAWLHT